MKLRLLSSILFCCFLLCADIVSAQNKIANPVVSIYDGCVERFMGYYYAMGTGTVGKIYRSKNMVSWEEPVLAAPTHEAQWLNDPKWTQAYTYKRVGAGDILYRNGVFHIYFNGIGHSYSDKPLGVYKEHSITEPFDDYGIDVQVFQDEDGKLYYLKKINPEDPHPITGSHYPKSGPEIWTFEMNSPFVRKGINGSVQMTHQRGHPTNIDLFNFEGPELFKYRDNYYHLFSPNRMSARTGMYQIGVAQSDGPINFTNQKKYPHPVLTRNSENHPIIYKQLLHTAEHGPWEARYMTAPPLGNWIILDYDDSVWKEGKGGFGLKNTDLALIRGNRTIWNTNKIYIRRKFNLNQIPRHPALKYRVEANTTFYINGNKLSINENKTAYSLIDLNPEWFHEGENIIAVEAENSCSGETCFKFVDFGLFDTGDYLAEKIVTGPAQANCVIGPNGFERWIMYKAFFNGVSAQGIDRMHFYDKELVVESGTSFNSPGYHPVPAMPGFISYFDHPIYYPYEFRDHSRWTISGGILKPEGNAAAELFFRSDSLTHYRYEVPFRIKEGGNDFAGIYAYYKDNDNYVKIIIDRDNAQWEYEIKERGSSTVRRQHLPPGFKFLENDPLVAAYEEPWHTLTIYKNGGNFKVELDYFNLTIDRIIQTELTGKGKIGLIASSGNTGFDAIQYTQGWDEWDNRITGWESEKGNWSVSEKGLQQTRSEGIAQTFKGDKSWNYEFSVFLSNDVIPNNGKAGYFPLYINEDNYIKTVINYTTGQLEISGKEKGKDKETRYINLDRHVSKQYTVENYPTHTYRYDFRSETELSGVDILWFEGYYPYLNQTFDLPKEVTFYALTGEDRWIPLDVRLKDTLRFSYFNNFSFDKIRTKAIKMEVLPPQGKTARAFSAYFREDLASDYYLRCRRENNQLYLFVNDALKAVVEGTWEDPSRVGLYTESVAAAFNGILHYQTGKVPVKEINVPSVECAIGHSISLNAEVYPMDATHKELVWESSDPSIASIDKKNRLTRHKEGSVTLTAWATDGGLIKGSVLLETPTGIPSVSGSGLQIYPNPVKNHLTIKADSEIRHIKLYSITGIKVKEYPELENQMQITLNMETVSSGIYTLQIQTSKETVSTKIIKNN